MTYAGQVNAIRAAIFLGRGQIDLAVEPDGLDLVRQRFTTLNHLRLLSSDPLFLSQSNHFCVQTAHFALTEMRQKYYDETGNTLLLWDRLLADWFAAEIKRFDKLILHYQSQC